MPDISAHAWRLVEYPSVHDTVAAEDVDEIDALLSAMRRDDVVVHASRHRLVPRLADFPIRSEMMSLFSREARRIPIRSSHDNRHEVERSCTEAHAAVSACSRKRTR